MTAPRVETPTVGAIRSAWRKWGRLRAQQAWRVLRLFGITLTGQVFAQYVSTGHVGQLDRKAFVALAVGAAEAVWRQYHPTITASQIDAAPGVAAVETDDTGSETVSEVGERAELPTVVWDERRNSYPRRTTASADLTEPVLWLGPVAPPVTGGYAVPGTDEWQLVDGDEPPRPVRPRRRRAAR